MPRDNNKDNDSPRGRRDGPARGPRKSAGPRGAGPRGAGPRGEGPRREGPKRDGARPAGARGGERKSFAKPRSGPGREGGRDDKGGRWQKRDGAGGDPRRERFGRKDGEGRSRPSRAHEASSDRPRRDYEGGERRPRRSAGETERRSDRPRSNQKRDEARSEGRGGAGFGRDRDHSAPWRERGGEASHVGRREGGGDRHGGPRGDRDRDERPRFNRAGAERRGDREFEQRPRRSFEKGEGGDRRRSPEKGDRSRGWGEERRSEGRDRPPPRQRRSDGDRPRFDRAGAERRGDREFDKRPRRIFDRREDRDGAQRRDDRGENRFREWGRDRPRRDDGEEAHRRPAFGGRGAYRERDAGPRPEEPKEKKPGERIAKVLARAGIASRRNAEVMITQGRVTVNGRTLNSPALDVVRDDVITVDGVVVPPRERTRLFLYHKPRGRMTTHSDPEGRPTVFDHLPEGLPRVISIGRLDFNTEGLLLLTNDGGLARVLELPDTGWLRRYRVRAHGEITQSRLDELQAGIEVDGVRYGPIEATLERNQGANVWMLLAIREGKNREVRNVLAHLGLEVNRLIRVSYGPFQLGELGEGEVEEVKPRVLREQLGDKVIARAGADFEAPRRDPDAGAKRSRAPVRKEAITDRKGRRVVVQRSGNEEDARSSFGPPRRPKRGYHGKRDVTPRED
ncbi:MAG: pseudouridine synthase [Alphaproteobacteria bacterium]|nr:pseudouridine synthase [Alphaproteobacteria bacterium]